MPSVRTGRDGYGLAPATASINWTEARATFTVFTTKDGLPDDIIEAILEDGQGYLWLATHNGLSRFHPPTKTFRNYSESDGLPGNFLNPYGVEASWQSQDGEMVFGSMNGVTAFYPERLSPNPYVPPVVLTEFHLFNKPVNPGQGLSAPQAYLGNGFPDPHSRTEYLHAGIRWLELCRSGEEPVSLSAGGAGIRMERGG